MSNKKISSFADLRKQNERERTPNANDNRDPDNLFTGGEKSGLAVQNPNGPNRPGSSGNRAFGGGSSSGGPSGQSAQDLVNHILDQASQNGPTEGDDDDTDEESAKPKTLAFQGRGRSLKSGDDNEDEEEEEDGDAIDTDNQDDLYNQLFPGSRLPRVTRRLTFWRNGFTVEDGPLYSYDDPANVNVLRAMERGNAPLSLLNVQPGQGVDVNVTRQLDQDYVAPKPKPGGYHGAGRRLGSPVPGDVVSGSSSGLASGSASGISTPVAGSTDKGKVADLGEGDAVVQLRLCDGSRHKRKFVASGPIEQLYKFVSSEMERNGDSGTREWVLQTTFPNKELSDKSQSLKDAGVVGAVVVQKWKS